MGGDDNSLTPISGWDSSVFKACMAALSPITTLSSSRDPSTSGILFQDSSRLALLMQQRQRQQGEGQKGGEGSASGGRGWYYGAVSILNISGQMGKKTNGKKSEACEGRWCQKHHFQVRPFLVMLNHPKECSVRLCPRLNRQRKTFQSPLPLLNPDRKFYTPLFILEEDQKIYVDHDRSNFRSFESSRMLEEQEISQIMVPKAASSSAYCKVCREQYSDYLQHTHSQGHHQRIAGHPYSAFIAELVDNFKPTNFEQKNQTLPELGKRAHDCLLEEEIECQGLQKEIECQGLEKEIECQGLEKEIECQGLEKETALRVRQSQTQKMEAEPRF